MSNVFPTGGGLPGPNNYQPVSPVLAAIYRLYSAPRGACRPSLDLDAFNGLLQEIGALYDLSGLAGDNLGAGSKLLPNGFGNLANAVKMMAWKAQTPCLSELAALGIVPENGFPRSYVDDSGDVSVVKQWDCETNLYIEVGATEHAQSLTLTAATTLTSDKFNWLIKITGSSGFTTTLPTPVLNGGKGRYVIYNASSVAQTLATPAGTFSGPFGSGTSSLTIPAGATIVLISDGTNWVVLASSTISAVVPYGVNWVAYARILGGAGISTAEGTIVSGSAIAALPATTWFDPTPSKWQGIWRVLTGGIWSDGSSNNVSLIRIS